MVDFLSFLLNYGLKFWASLLKVSPMLNFVHKFGASLLEMFDFLSPLF